MTIKKYEIVLKFVKDLSVEIPDPDTFIVSREYITKYSLGINITTNPIKNEMIEIITKLTYRDPGENKRKSFFEILFSTVIKINDKSLKKKDLEKIILCDVQNEIYPELERIFLGIIRDSGFPDLKLEKKINFEQLYQQQLN
tara:strand:+ start:717 stop:1142 length:426 start_codon:yes stop_codon:yes gene_type:complete